jgi:hypothetical protein
VQFLRPTLLTGRAETLGGKPDRLPGPWGAELDILRREAVPVGLSLLGLATLEGLRKATSGRIKHHDFRRRVLKIKKR